MNIKVFRYLSAPSKFLPALIALGINAIFFWGVVRPTAVLPPEHVSRVLDAAVGSRDRSGLVKGSEDEESRARFCVPPRQID